MIGLQIVSANESPSDAPDASPVLELVVLPLVGDERPTCALGKLKSGRPSPIGFSLDDTSILTCRSAGSGQGDPLTEDEMLSTPVEDAASSSEIMSSSESGSSESSNADERRCDSGARRSCE